MQTEKENRIFIWANVYGSSKQKWSRLLFVWLYFIYGILF